MASKQRPLCCGCIYVVGIETKFQTFKPGRLKPVLDRATSSLPLLQCCIGREDASTDLFTEPEANARSLKLPWEHNTSSTNSHFAAIAGWCHLAGTHDNFNRCLHDKAHREVLSCGNVQNFEALRLWRSLSSLAE